MCVLTTMNYMGQNLTLDVYHGWKNTISYAGKRAKSIYSISNAYGMCLSESERGLVAIGFIIWPIEKSLKPRYWQFHIWPSRLLLRKYELMVFFSVVSHSEWEWHNYLSSIMTISMWIRYLCSIEKYKIFSTLT